MTSVSVVIPAYGPCPHLAAVLEAILAGTQAPDEIVVSHSGSDDPTDDIAARFPSVRVLHEDGRLFAGAARNRGAAVAKGEILAFCDADTRPGPDWLAEVTTALAADRKRFLVGAVGVARRGGYWGMSNWLLEFSEQAPWRPEGEQPGGASCNMAVRAEDFAAVGGFRADMRISEDTTLFSDLRTAGLSQVFCPGAVVEHFNNSGFGAFARHQTGLGAAFANLRMQRDLPGSFLVRRPPLAMLLWGAKAYVVLKRTVLCGVRPAAVAAYLAPGVIVGSFIWSAASFRRALALRHEAR